MARKTARAAESVISPELAKGSFGDEACPTDRGSLGLAEGAQGALVQPE